MHYFQRRPKQLKCRSTFLSKGLPTSLISTASYSIWGSKLSLGVKWRRDWILGPCDSWIWAPMTACSPPIGGYGVRLIRLCLSSRNSWDFKNCEKQFTIFCSCRWIKNALKNSNYIVTLWKPYLFSVWRRGFRCSVIFLEELLMISSRVFFTKTKILTMDQIRLWSWLNWKEVWMSW